MEDYKKIKDENLKNDENKIINFFFFNVFLTIVNLI